MDRRAGRYGRLETIEIADILLPEEDIHKGTQLTGLVTNIEAQPGILPIERFNDLADRPAIDRDRPPMSGAREERAWNAHLDQLCIHDILRGQMKRWA